MKHCNICEDCYVSQNTKCDTCKKCVCINSYNQICNLTEKDDVINVNYYEY